ncbi:MAG: arsenic resistance N-acetyltransferase ArsN2 [Pseudomonadota bacterium]
MQTPTNTDLPAIASLLSKSGLPIDDLDDQDLSLFRIVGDPDALVAVAGLERQGDLALIRSVATATSVRGQGIAKALVADLEALAIEKGIDAIYLLTETAERFFAHLGYIEQDRTRVPPSIQRSRQFSSICPDSATVMCKSL